MLDRLATSVAEKLKAAGLPAGYLDEMPYPVWAIEELEVEMQVINTVGIQAFFDGKLKDAEMKQWDWHGYMKNNFRDHFPAKRLFDDEYQKLFSDLQ